MNALLYNLLLIVLYTYFGYFGLVLLLGALRRKKVHKADIEPHVTILIAAYNEEKAIAKKLEETLELDYPKDKLRIVVVSDASSDRTDEIVKSFESRGVELLRVEGRVGKTEARNVAMASLNTEIVIFSDATTIYDKSIVRKFVRNFADPSVGMVTAHLIYQDPGSSIMGFGQIIYWKYESLLKKAQTAMGTLTGSVGCATALRHSLYSPMPSNIIEDFTGALLFILKGQRVVFEEEAICYEDTTRKCSNEWQMRVRVARGGMKGLLYARKILNPFLYPLPFFQLVSHKILRWFLPVFLILLLIVNIACAYNDPENSFVMTLLALQTSFYLVGLISYIFSQFGVTLKLASIPLYFVILNAACLVALGKTMMTDLEATWEPQREEDTHA